MSKIDVSVIIPLYNSAEWIRECIDSVISQENQVNLELIVIDDGSSDNSPDLVRAYCENHQNIKLLFQNHGHQGKARNTGIAEAKGEYIVFLDADDILLPGVLKLFFTQAVSDQCDFVVGIAESFNNHTTWINEGYQSYNTKVSNTNIDRYPNLLMDPSSCNKFYRSSFLKNNGIRFPENTYCEDVEFIYNAYFLAQNISILPEIIHYYRAREKAKPASGTQTFSEERISQCADIYGKLLDQYQKTSKPEIYDLLQARAVIRISRFFHRVKVFPDSTSYLYEALQDLFLKIEPEIIVKNAEKFSIPFFMLREGCYLHAVAIMKSPDNNTALCDFFRLLVSKDHKLAYIFFRDCIIYPQKSIITKSRKNIKFFSFRHTTLKTVKKLKSLKLKSIKQYYIVKQIGDYIVKPILFLWFSLVAKVFNCNVWLIGERGGKSIEENGYIFFKYCQNQKQANNVYYVVEKQLIEAFSLHKQKNILAKNSFKHIYFLGFMRYAVFSNDIGDVCPDFIANRMRSLQKVFLTHGVKLYGPGVYMRNRANAFNFILVSSELEKQTMKYQWNISDDSKLIVTGLPRFDNLLDASPKNEILFCPTWRKYLAQLDREQFLESLFFKKLAQLLEDPYLLNFLNDHDMVLVLRCHFNLEKHLSSFQKLLTSRIRIESGFGIRNLQQAIKEARMLITDYSSILWDMAYMRRPVILYQFDREAFLAERGLHSFGIDESEMKFARLANNSKEVIEFLKIFGLNDFALTPDEAYNADSFFAYRDINNCKRVYELISSAG